jgi:hypothetical protein
MRLAALCLGHPPTPRPSSAFAASWGRGGARASARNRDVPRAFAVGGGCEFSARADAPPTTGSMSVRGRVSSACRRVHPLRLAPLDPSRAKPTTGGGSGPSGLHGFLPVDNPATLPRPVRRSGLRRADRQVPDDAAVSRSIVPRRASGSWAQDAFPSQRDRPEAYARFGACEVERVTKGVKPLWGLGLAARN